MGDDSEKYSYPFSRSSQRANSEHPLQIEPVKPIIIASAGNRFVVITIKCFGMI